VERREGFDNRENEMTRDEFLSLPANVALGLLLDGSAKLKEIVESTEKPRSPLSPKFDRKVYRKGGFTYASEMSLENLTYWLGKKREGAVGGGQYADKDAKDAEQLDRWVKYRSWFPNDPWTGTRGDSEGVRAAPPSKSPRIHATQPKDQGTYEAPVDHYSKDGNFGVSEYGENSEDDIPF
jgi:hypothetical protein